MPLDHQNLLKALELIALPGTLLNFKAQKGRIIEVSMPGYPNEKLFVDERFVSEKSDFSKPAMPSKKEMVERMTKLVGKPYIWGGNYSQGIPEMLDYYPPSRTLSALELNTWTFAGVDCSGLLYEASGGLTPRNTAELISFGEERALEDLQPLDLLVWKGHVVIVLDPYHTIESRLGMGVVITPLVERLSEIERELATDLFVRRAF